MQYGYENKTFIPHLLNIADFLLQALHKPGKAWKLLFRHVW